MKNTLTLYANRTRTKRKMSQHSLGPRRHILLLTHTQTETTIERNETKRKTKKKTNLYEVIHFAACSICEMYETHASFFPISKIIKRFGLLLDFRSANISVLPAHVLSIHAISSNFHQQICVVHQSNVCQINDVLWRLI